MKKKIVLTLLLLHLICFQVSLVNCLPRIYLGSDPDDVEPDFVDIKDCYYSINGESITFTIVCYEKINPREKISPKVLKSFQICLDIKPGKGDNRKKVMFKGADIIIASHNNMVFHWNGKSWIEDKKAHVTVKEKESTIYITVTLSTINFQKVAGDIKIGFIGTMIKGKKLMFNEGQDRAPDRGWWKMEGGVPDLGLIMSAFTMLSGFSLAYIGVHSKRKRHENN